MSIRMRSVRDVLVCIALIGASSGCRRDEDAVPSDQRPDTVPTQQVGVLVFPDELRVDDASVNDFLRQAMTVCTTGDYEAFRLLWSARQDPLPRDEFEKGWQAVLEIKIRALEEIILAPDDGADPSEGQTVYVTCADVRLDPKRLTREQEPERQVILMLAQEHDEWRLAKAPEQVRAWLKEKVAASATDAGESEQDEPRVEEDAG